MVAKGTVTTKKSAQGQWSSPWIFVLATMSAAIGLGNIWKFPYITGENGGGSFIFIYLICIFVVDVPLLMAELMIGRLAKRNPFGAMKELSLASKRNPAWRWVGALGILAGAVLLSYYSIIAGWGLHYVFEAGMGHFVQATPEDVGNIFTALLANPFVLVFWQLIIMALTVGIVMLGVKKGLEYAIRFLFPSMLLILVLLVIYAFITSPVAFKQAATFLFTIDFSTVPTESVLIALGHSFFTLSLAIGSIMTYGAYIGPNTSIPKTSFIIAIGDTIMALLVALAIFPIVFTHGLEPSSGPGLLFITVPISFGDMPFGSTVACLFFLMIVFAAFATTISLLEPSVAWLNEKYKMSRKKAALFAGVVIWLFGLISLLSLNIWSSYMVFNMNFFDLIDYINSNIMLPVGGLLISLFAGWVLRKDLLSTGLGIQKNGLCYYTMLTLLGVIIPISIVVIFLSVIGLI